MVETWAMETSKEGGSSLCPCLSLLHPLFFLAPIKNTFRCLLGRLYRSETSLTFLDSLTWAMLRYATLNFSTNTHLLWQGECLISQQFYQTWSVVLLILFCDRFCLSFQWESCSIFKVIEQGLHLSQSQGISFAVMKNVTSISLWLNQEYNFILTQWILACLVGTWK